MAEENKIGLCPICSKSLPIKELVEHVDACIFFNTDDNEITKRKREPSPSKSHAKPKFQFKHKSPRDAEKQKILAPIFQRNRPSSSRKIVEETIVVEKENGSNKKKLSFSVPLAKQMQPKSLDDFFGQIKALGKDTVLRGLLGKGEIPNMILWGPPGCGKTSLSNVIHEICKKNPKQYRFKALSATDDGVKNVRTVISEAKTDMKFGKKMILFMDEIHRFNKKQQDTFLLSVEKGEITLIGATTENPSFSLNNALLSRCRVIVMEKLDCESLFSILSKATEALDIDVVDGNNPCGIINDDTRTAIEEEALQWLCDISDGDARIALSNLQVIFQHCDEKGKVIKLDDVKEQVKKSHMLYDRAGEEHYNLISAMHKSIRGSDENAALYWTTRMMVSGEDPMYIARRLVRAASEDIGNADPHALPLAIAAMQGCQMIGMPEADCLLAQCAIYLARAPKSREADSALAAAKNLIKNCQGPQPNVPMQIRNAPTKLMKDLGYGELEDGAEFTFMPPELKDVNFFK
ncbi:unnamed protein product [Brassicogethes aeneus]|uniref:AAA+ ATPase domain-containing protein n=1 Tax=Brassicogethes aeneus TaxID=1431903 RepID=A0A9P0B9B6_BRAAE|nr:unnamed protein product [Brassicogethes aeneus]